MFNAIYNEIEGYFTSWKVQLESCSRYSAIYKVNDADKVILYYDNNADVTSIEVYKNYYITEQPLFISWLDVVGEY